MSAFLNIRFGVVYGIPATIGAGCPISCTFPDDDRLPVFTFGDQAATCAVHFDPEPLREFVILADEALTQLAPSRNPAQPSTTGAGAATQIDLEPWVWISQGCPMDYVITRPDHVQFRFGDVSPNLFEPAFHPDALRRLVPLARDALARACPTCDMSHL